MRSAGRAPAGPINPALTPDKLTEMWNAGRTDNEIAREYGMNYSSVRAVRRRLGLLSARKPAAEFTPAKIAEIQAMRAAGAKKSEVAKKYGITNTDTLNRVLGEGGQKALARKRPGSGAPSRKGTRICLKCRKPFISEDVILFQRCGLCKKLDLGGLPEQFALARG